MRTAMVLVGKERGRGGEPFMLTAPCVSASLAAWNRTSSLLIQNQVRDERPVSLRLEAACQHKLTRCEQNPTTFTLVMRHHITRHRCLCCGEPFPSHEPSSRQLLVLRRTSCSSVVQTTMMYVHLTSEDLRAEIEELASLPIWIAVPSPPDQDTEVRYFNLPADSAADRLL